MSKFKIIENSVNDQTKQFFVNVFVDVNKAEDYKLFLEQVLNSFDEAFNYHYLIHSENYALAKNIMNEKISSLFVEKNKSSTNHEDINQKNIKDIVELKRQIDNCFYTTFPQIVPKNNTSENADELDKELLDKITPLVPEGTEILLKNVVKEIQGTAKGLSDFVLLFTKYRQSILSYNGIEYFQRKGCHFLRKA